MSAYNKCLKIMNSLSFEFLPVIHLTERDIEIAIDFGIRKAIHEMGKNNYKQDKYKLEVRFAKGACGEIAVEKYIGEKFANLNVGDRNSREFRGADLKAINIKVGVKCFIPPYVPMVTINDTYEHQIMTKGDNTYIKKELNGTIIPDTLTILGVASPKILKKFSDRSYICNNNIDSVKLGFYGLDKVNIFDSKEELIRICQTT